VTSPQDEPATREPIRLRDALRVWAYVALNSFGGPAGQVAVMHTELVDKHRWISERRFLHALNYCMLLPGPEAQQLSVYIGWLLHGVRGGLLAGLLFVLPGFVAILGLSVLYSLNQDATFVEALFYGLKPAVLAIVAAAVVRVAKRALTQRLHVAIAVSSYVAISVFSVPFPAVILVAGIVGLAAGRAEEERDATGHGGRTPASGTAPLLADHDEALARPSARRTAVVLLVGGLLWLGPVLALVALFGPANVYATQAVFFSGAAVVTFGGAYAVLTYVAQQVVGTLGWLTPAEMLDGLAMAETTPGPLIMVVEFVGFLAAYRNPGALEPLVAGILGAVLVTWVTFVPSFLWIFAGAPYAESLRANRRLTSALSGVTAAVVGAILNLAVWFGLHAIFREVLTVPVGPATLNLPVLSSVDGAALILAILAGVAVFRLRWSTLRVLALAAAAGAAWYAVAVS
jgi:chromate transporter